MADTFTFDEKDVLFFYAEDSKEVVAPFIDALRERKYRCVNMPAFEAGSRTQAYMSAVTQARVAIFITSPGLKESQLLKQTIEAFLAKNVNSIICVNLRKDFSEEYADAHEFLTACYAYPWDDTPFEEAVERLMVWINTYQSVA